MNSSKKGIGVAVLRGMYIVLCSAMLLSVAETQAQAQSLMTHHVRPAVINKEAKFLNRLPETQTLRLDIVLPLRDQAGLDDFLQEVYDPASPSYRHFLTVPEFTARFGPSQEDYDAVVGYVESRGFKVVGGSRDGMDVQLEGSVAVIEAAFNVSMGVYQHPTEGRTFYAPDREPSVYLPFPLWHISGLDNYSIPHPAGLHKNPGTQSNATTGSGPSASFLGSDMRAAYYGGTALTGAGQNIGLLEFVGYDLSDLTTYYTNAHQPSLVGKVIGVSTDGTSLSCSGGCDDTEQILDMTQALGMAPGIDTLYVFVGSTDTAMLSSMSTHTPLCAQLSSSWTWQPADPSTDDPIFQRFAAQGQNYFQASGDSGSYTRRSKYVFPADDAYVTSVGGTDLQTSSAGGPWSSETVWADGGGGYFTPDAIPIPSWQKLAGVITSSNKGSTTLRNGPDVSANSNYTFYVCADQKACTANLYGGTSFAAPMWAGYMALVNQQAIANRNAPLGFINPLIYPLGLGSGYTTDFHDITSGSNGYSAVTSYDLATGWGSPNGEGLINALAGTSSSPNFAISASPSSVSVVQGSQGTSTITTTISGGFDSAIDLSATGQPAGVNVGFNPAPIAAPGNGSSIMTMTVASTTGTGTYPITVTGAGAGGGLTHTTTVTLKVTAPASPNFTLSASLASLNVKRGSQGTSRITINPTNGFTGGVTLSNSALPSGVTASFSPNPATSTSTLTLAVGSAAATGTTTVTITGVSGSLSNTTTVSLKIHP